MRASLPLLTLVRLQFTTFLGSSKVELPPLAILKVQRRIVTLDISTGRSVDYCSGDPARFGEVALGSMTHTREPQLIASTMQLSSSAGDSALRASKCLPTSAQQQNSV